MKGSSAPSTMVIYLFVGKVEKEIVPIAAVDLNIVEETLESRNQATELPALVQRVRQPYFKKTTNRSLSRLGLLTGM